MNPKNIQFGGFVLIIIGVFLFQIAYYKSSILYMLVPLVIVCVGLFLMYIPTTKIIKVPVDKSDAVPGEKALVEKRIIITINDNGLSLTTEGLSPQDVIGILELSKFYVMNKTLNTGLLIDTVKRT